VMPVGYSDQEHIFGSVILGEVILNRNGVDFQGSGVRDILGNQVSHFDHLFALVDNGRLIFRNSKGEDEDIASVGVGDKQTVVVLRMVGSVQMR